MNRFAYAHLCDFEQYVSFEINVPLCVLNWCVLFLQNEATIDLSIYKGIIGIPIRFLLLPAL